MDYREAKTSRDNPALVGEDLDRFLYEFANLDTVATRVKKDGTIIPYRNDTAENYYCMSHLLGWKWWPQILMEVACGTGWPEPDFVEFVHQTVVRLGLIEYKRDAKAMQEYEAAMQGRCRFTRSTSGEYAFAAQIGFEAWCRAHKRENIYGK